ncbi:MAG: CBS domain-containing protein [Rhodothermaceae bacterium]|nr:CBS domain-containing protein [Rhodothermaceae bacterium]
MLIGDILDHKGRDIYSVPPDSTVYEAIALMSEKNIGALLVLDGGEIAGIITERDYRNKVILQGRSSKTTPVRDIMTENVNYVTSKQTVRECMALMTSQKFRHCPVVDDGKLVGIVSIGDLVNAVITEQKVEINYLKNYITGSYPN